MKMLRAEDLTVTLTFPSGEVIEVKPCFSPTEAQCLIGPTHVMSRDKYERIKAQKEWNKNAAPT